MRIRRRLALLALCALLVFGTARAAVFPALETLQAGYEGGQAYHLCLSARVDAWPDLAEQSLAALQSWLEGQRLEVDLRQDGDHRQAAAQWAGDGQVVFTLATAQDPQEAGLILEVPGSLPATRYLGSPAQPPWQALFGSVPQLMDPAAAGQAFTDLCRAALPHLLPMEKPVKTAISIRNAGRGASQLVYALNKEQAQAFWQAAGSDLLPVMDRLLLALAPSRAAALSGSLRALEIRGALNVKRFLDKQGEDLGLQVTATLGLDGATRKLTLFGGRSDSGVYLSFKLPATRGSDTVEAQLSLATKPGSAQGDWKFRTVSGKERLDASGKITLTSVAQAEGERLGGSLSAKIRRAGVTTDYEVVPDLLLGQDRLTGSLRLRELAGKTVRREVSLALEMSPADSVAMPMPLAEVDLLSLDDEARGQAAGRVNTALVPALRGWLAALPGDLRRLVLHDLGRDRRARGEGAVPPVNTEVFTVTEEMSPSTSEEDIP